VLLSDVNIAYLDSSDSVSNDLNRKKDSHFRTHVHCTKIFFVIYYIEKSLSKGLLSKAFTFKLNYTL